MPTSLSGKVKVTPFDQLDSGRYQFLELGQAEPNFGLPRDYVTDSAVGYYGAVLVSDSDGERRITDELRLGGLSFKPNVLEQINNNPSYFLVLKGDPTDANIDSVGWSLGTFEEVDTLQTVTDRGSSTTQGIAVGSLTTTANALIGTDLVVTGNLTVNGTNTIINSVTMTVDDKNIVLAEGAADAIAADGGGITLDGANASMTYSATDNRWEFNRGLQTGFLSIFDSVRVETLDVEDLFVGGRLEFDSADRQVISKQNGELDFLVEYLGIKTKDDLTFYAEFSNDAISFEKQTTFTDSVEMDDELRLLNVPEKALDTKILFRRQSDGLVQQGDIDVEALAQVDKIKVEDTEVDDNFPIVLVQRDGLEFDSAKIDSDEFTYNPSSNTLNLINLDVTGFANLDSTDVAGDFQILSGGRLLDSEERAFVVYDSAGRLLWGNNGISAGNGGLGSLLVAELNDLSDVTITQGTLADDQYLQYNSALSQWENVTVAPGGGGGGATSFDQLSDAQTASLDIDKVALSAITRLVVTANGSSAYRFDQYGTTDNPIVHAHAGTTLAFDLDLVPSHPFNIRFNGTNFDTGVVHVSSNGTVTTGASAQNQTSGTLYWKIPDGLEGNQYGYICGNHSGMVGVIDVMRGDGYFRLLDLTDVTGDGTNGQVLTTNGNGSFSFADQSGGGGGTGNKFTKIAVSGQSDIDADAENDTLTLVGGTGISITTNDTTDTLTIEASGGSGLQSRATPSVVSGSIANNATANVTATVAPSYALLKIQTNQAAWVRVYTDATSRTADASRLITDDPTPDAGVIAEVITTGSETIKLSPATIGWTDDASTSVPIAITNRSGGTTDITVTLTTVNLEQ